MSPHPQDRAHAHSLSDPESFWLHHASKLHWHKPPSRAIEHTTTTLSRTSTSDKKTTHPSWTWFPDGEISTTWNCVDRHVSAGNGDNVALVWESAVTDTRQEWTYKRLLDEVEVLAGVLKEEGVKKGDVVLLYMPMIPPAIFAILAIARLGAIHAAVFGGFAASSLAQRIDAAKPVLIMTASCGIEGAKGALDYRPLVRGAIEQSQWKPGKTIIWQRLQKRWGPVMKEEGERDWARLVKSARDRGKRAAVVPVKSSDGLYIIYTSGTTGSPKGVVRQVGGHAVGLALSIAQLFNIKGPGDVMFCASDIGWVVGHSYIVYGPLLAGATTVLFEGKPIGTPDAGTFWRIIERNRVNILFTAPTALRAIKKDDGENEFLKEVGKRGGLKSLEALFLAGERSEPSIVTLYQDLLTQYAAPKAKVIDNWWSSESGSPMTGICLRPELGCLPDEKVARQSPLAIKPGSAGKPLPGFSISVVSDDGEPVPSGTLGNIVLNLPLAPTAFTTLYNDPTRFYKGYLLRFQGRYIDTGDAGLIDGDGYVHIMSRSDDIINVAAHRFSTGAIEQVLLSHPYVGEACVVGIPDDLKGHLPFAFIQPATKSNAVSANEEISATLPADILASLNASIRSQIGAIAALGGAIQGRGMIPKTRSGKTLRRVLRELLENGVNGTVEKAVNVPPTVEDAEVVEVARQRVKLWAEETMTKEKPKARL